MEIASEKVFKGKAFKQTLGTIMLAGFRFESAEWNQNRRPAATFRKRLFRCESRL